MILLKGVGEANQSIGFNSEQPCCDVCTNGRIDPQLDVLQPGSATTKRRKAVWSFDDTSREELKRRLVQVRDSVIAENPTLGMVGSTLVCPDVTIDELCVQAKFISKEDDLDILFGIRTIFRNKFFNIIMDVASTLPPSPKKRRRRN